MSMQSAFLADIAGNPEDDAPRLVYADWLEENGEPERARFIRAQCRMASMGRYELERYDLEGEAEALLKKHGKKWLKPIAKITTNVEFKRGFPHRISLPAAKFVAQGADAFAAAPTLREYRVLQPKAAWEELLACPVLEKLASFDVGHQPGITIPRVQALAKARTLRNLRELNLADVPLSRTIADLGRSPHLVGLRKLNAYKCALGSAGLSALLRAKFAGSLTDLNVSQNELDAAAVSKLARWKGAAGLEVLTLSEYHQYLSRLRLGDDAASAFAAGDWSGLRHLTLFFHEMGSAGLAALGGCASLSGLRSLNISYKPDQGMAGLLSSPHLAGLENVRLNAQADLTALATAPMLPNLRHLHIGGTGVASLEAILSKPASAGLRELSLGSSGTRPDGRAFAEIIAGASHLTNLRHLALSGLPLGVEGARAFGGAGHLAGLVELELSWGCVDEKSALALAKTKGLSRLRKLEIGGIPGLFGPSYEALQKRFGEDVVKR
jgi:uncharacterized protein (TIGR02996 family)